MNYKKLLSKSKYGVLVIISLVLFTQCVYVFEELFMPDKRDEKYLPNYIKGDLLFFKSKSNVDTFEVTKAGYAGSYEGEGMHQVSVYWYSIDLVDSVEHSFYINRRISGYSFFEFGNEYVHESEFDLKSTDTSIVIGGVTISNLSQSFDLSTDYVYRRMDTDTMVVLKTFMFEKNYGLVQYELNNGETFLLDEKSLKMLMERE